MAADLPLLSIVTGTRNRPELLADMVKSVLENTEHPFELLIGEASDGEPFESNDPRVRVLRETVPLGSVRGYNELFKHARADFVCFLNDDLVVRPGWSTAIFDVFNRHPEVDMACLPLVEPDEPEPFIMLYREVPVVQMGVLRKEAGNALGWFNERFAFYSIDLDLTYRLIESGRRLAPVYGNVMMHFKVEDSVRDGNAQNFDDDNALMTRTWKHRQAEILKKYRRTSYRYFKGLETRHSEGYNCTLLTIPESPDTRPPRPLQPYRLKRRSFRKWLKDR